MIISVSIIIERIELIGMLWSGSKSENSKFLFASYECEINLLK